MDFHAVGSGVPTAGNFRLLPGDGYRHKQGAMFPFRFPSVGRTTSWFAWFPFLALVGVLGTIHPATSAPSVRPPNVVLIFCDDLGWADIGCYGARTIRTPNLDRLARQGTRFTNFYVAQAVCSASRAALLTGCYPNRIGIHGALGPQQRIGLHPEETTLAEVLRGKGYTTAMFGKWHLGRPRSLLPIHHGFQEYLGLPYSNDMWPRHPSAKPGSYPPLPLIEGDRVVRELEDQSDLTRMLTDRSVDFIKRNSDKPFFLYLAHPMPHVPLYAGTRFKNRSGRGVFTDVIEELDWSTGEIMKTLRRLDLERNTLVIFTSDNGPWLSYGDHAGSAGPFREGKGTSFEGGIRVPCIVRWPGHMPQGKVSGVPWMTIDLLPTLARLVDAPLPSRPIDGRDVWPVISGQPGASHPQAAYFIYYNQGELQAVISDGWKLFLPHTSRTLNGRPGGKLGIPASYQPLPVGLELYHLLTDPGERTNVMDQHPEQLQRLLLHAESAREELGDSLTRRVGRGVRPAAVVEPGESD
jgi:arylsulfatase A-like enzyme